MTFSDITDAMELCSRLTLMAKGTETCNYYKSKYQNNSCERKILEVIKE